MYQIEDTICAIATPAGTGGIGIIRLSGPQALALASSVFEGTSLPARRREILFGKFKDPASGEILDEGLLLVMPGPASYTGEDVVEFHAHGSSVLLGRLMEVLVSLGARLALAGEFTYRAFSHGRLDLTQAEAVEALVGAQGEASRRQALRQLTGGLAAHLEPMEEALKSLYLKIEARLEFSEDGIPPLDREKFRQEASGVQAELRKLSQSYRQGKVIREGLTVALVGPPNTGKSSLLNALLGTNRAIVTPEAGTTRDLVEGEIQLKGVRVRLFDTAGIRKADGVVEAEGIRRSRQVMEEADVLFWLVDASSPSASLIELKNESLPLDRTWFLFNKMDLVKSKELWAGTGLAPDRCLGISCQTGQGLEAVTAQIESLFQVPFAGEDMMLTSARHQGEVQKAAEALQRLEGLQKSQAPFELWAEELKEAILAIGRVRGRNLSAAAFEEIFSKFCIGK